MQVCYEGKKRLKKYGFIVSLVLAVLIFVIVSAGDGFNAKDAFAENESSNEYALCIVLTGNETPEDKRLLYASLAGLGVQASVFCNNEYITQNADEIKNAASAGHSICFLLDFPKDASKYELLRHIACENDDFFELTGKYPVFVKTVFPPSSDVLEILGKYGQILCDTESDSVLWLENVDASSVCELVKTLTELQSQGKACVSLKNLARSR